MNRITELERGRARILDLEHRARRRLNTQEFVTLVVGLLVITAWAVGCFWLWVWFVRLAAGLS